MTNKTISQLDELQANAINDLTKVRVLVQDQAVSPNRTKNMKLSTMLEKVVGATGPIGPTPVTWQLSSGTYTLTLGVDGQLTSSDGVLRAPGGISIDRGTMTYNPSSNTFVLGDSRTSTSTHFYFYTQQFSADPLAGMTYAQFHDSTLSNCLVLFRARGSLPSPQALITGDVYGRLLFMGYDGSTSTQGAQIAVSSAGVSTNGHTPSVMTFRVNNGSGFPITTAITSTGSFKTDKIGSLFSNTMSVESPVSVGGPVTYTPLSTAPSSPTAGMTAVCNGTGWNGGGDGLQHLMIYLNNTWVKIV